MSEDEDLRELFKNKVNLVEWTSEVDNESAKIEKSILKYYADNISTFNSMANDCRDICTELTKLEKYLYTFQEDLGNINDEIASLKSHSLETNISLKNRQIVQLNLKNYIKNAAIDPVLIKSIESFPLSSNEFIESLHELNHKIKTICSCENVNETNQLVSICEGLRNIACQRIKEHIVGRMSLIRKSASHHEEVQADLLSVRYIGEFMFHHENQEFQAIFCEYIKTVQKIYQNLLISYPQKLRKSIMKPNKKDHPIVFLGSCANDSVEAFKLNGRENVITKDLFSCVKIPGMLERRSHFIQIEEYFRSCCYVLVENCKREFFFLSDFFFFSTEHTVEPFQALFKKSFMSLLKEIYQELLECKDLVGLLLCFSVMYPLRIYQAYQSFPYLNRFFDRISELLLKQIEEVINENEESMKESFAKISADQSSILQSTILMTNNMSQLIKTLHHLSPLIPSLPVQSSIEKLRLTWKECIQTAVLSIPSKTCQMIYLLSCLHVLYSVLITLDDSAYLSLSESVSKYLSSPLKPSDSFSNFINKSTENLKKEIDTYVQVVSEEEVAKNFKFLIDFLNSYNEDQSPLQGEIEQQVVIKTLKSFQVSWKVGMCSIFTVLSKASSDYKLNALLVQHSLEYLLSNYQRFLEIGGTLPSVKTYVNKLKCQGMLIDINDIIQEAKNLKSSLHHS